jgi:hypothetical protein
VAKFETIMSASCLDSNSLLASCADCIAALYRILQTGQASLGGGLGFGISITLGDQRSLVTV